MRGRTRKFIYQAYDTVEAVLWAGLLAFVIGFAVFVAPYIPEMQAASARQEQVRAAQEMKGLCEKWGLPANSHEHTLCTIDLQHYRERIEQRMAEQSSF
jgi:hypothetical protein